MAKFLGRPLPCSAVASCASVLAHRTSMFLGVPVSVYGLVGYGLLAGLFFGLARGKSQLWPITAGVAAIGTVISLALQVVSFTVIHARCDWCITSAVVMTTLLVLTLTGVHREVMRQATYEPVTTSLIGAVLALSGCAFMGITMNMGTGAKVPEILGLDQYKVSDLVADPNSHWRGPKDAKIVVVEFADFFCPACRKSYIDFHEMLNTPPLKDKVKFYYRHYPLTGKEGHENSDLAAWATEFANKKGRFWPLVDLLFNVDVEELNTPEAVMAQLPKVGLDPKEFEKDLASTAKYLIDAVQGDQQRAAKAGASMTPTYFIFAEGVKPRSATSESIREIWSRPEYARLLK